MDWSDVKQLAAGLSLAKDALHIYGGIAIQLASCLLMRKPLASSLPWLAVLVLELLNESLDLLLSEEPYVGRWQIEGGIHDLINTMALPTVLLLLVRHVPRLFSTDSTTIGG